MAAGAGASGGQQTGGAPRALSPHLGAEVEVLGRREAGDADLEGITLVDGGVLADRCQRLGERRTLDDAGLSDLVERRERELETGHELSSVGEGAEVPGRPQRGHEGPVSFL